MLHLSWERNRRKAIVAFMLAYLYVVNGYWFFLGTPWRDALFGSGLWAGSFLGFGGTRWTVFSPNATHSDAWMYAMILADDGTPKIWRFPAKDRFIKYGEPARVYGRPFPRAWVGKKKDHMFWIDLARYVARMYYTPTFHPAIVYLIRHSEKILPPGQYRRASDYTQPKEEIVFAYDANSRGLEN